MGESHQAPPWRSWAGSERAGSTRYALMVTLVYAVVVGGYIVLSSGMAAHAAHTVDEMRRIETIKGVVYVVVTAAMIFCGVRFALLEMARDAAELRRREQALLVNQGRIFAGLTAASIAHDANNVLLVVLSELDLLESGQVHAEDVERLRQSVERLVSLNRRLLDSARTLVIRERATVDARDAVREVLEVLRSHVDVRRCKVECEAPTGVRIPGGPALMLQLVGNLVLNGAQAAGAGGRVAVRVREEGRHARIEVHDSGPGVPAERRASLFTSLSTTKVDGNGLGLFSVKACAGALGGDVEVGDSPLGGALFRVLLPLAGVTPAVAAAAPAPPH